MERLRKATEQDVEHIYNLISQLEERNIDNNNFSDIYNSNLLNPCVYYYVFEINNHIVGFISLHIQKLLHHTSNIAEIQEFIVSEPFRKNGIGQKMFKKAVDLSIENNCAQMEVCCNLKRLLSHKFYQSEGMTNNHFKFCLEL